MTGDTQPIEQLPLLDDENSGEQELSTTDERELKKRANDLDGASWTRNSISIWSDIRKNREEIELGHPAIFPSQLVTRLIESFTRNTEQYILDPFCGSGSTVVAASRMGRIGIGFEINQDYIDLANRRLMTRDLWQPDAGSESRIIKDDARNLLEHLDPESIDMVITSPPYWDVLSQRRTADNKNIRDYGKTVEDLGKIADYHAFLDELATTFTAVFTALRPSKYCAVVVMDLRKKNVFYPFHSDVAEMMKRIGFIYDDLIIWDRRHEYNNLRPLGFPAVFRVNKVHEFILLFQKPKV
ncbi:site-specific DNA-methyltransferase [Sphingobacteriales bacterium CHB3]|nr:site-specific DNA-methyltransferase [Sphingobacteriales bacterium CHB3]